MIGQVKGKVLHCTPTEICIEAGGVGYVAHVPFSTYEALRGKTEAQLYIHLQINENQHTLLLYGFSSQAEKAMFLALVGVSGVGASTALLALSAMPVQVLAQALAEEDIAKIQKIKGVGKRTAERLVVDLSEKMRLSVWMEASHATQAGHRGKPWQEEAIQALLRLGFQKKEAEKRIADAFSKCEAEGSTPTLENLVRRALKHG